MLLNSPLNTTNNLPIYFPICLQFIYNSSSICQFMICLELEYMKRNSPYTASFCFILSTKLKTLPPFTNTYLKLHQRSELLPLSKRQAHQMKLDDRINKNHRTEYFLPYNCINRKQDDKMKVVYMCFYFNNMQCIFALPG